MIFAGIDFDAKRAVLAPAEEQYFGAAGLVKNHSVGHGPAASAGYVASDRESWEELEFERLILSVEKVEFLLPDREHAPRLTDDPAR